MRKDREQANILRKSGMSYSEIKSKMSVARSTISSWFKDQKWSNDIAYAIVNKAKDSGAIRLMVLNTIRGNRLKKIYEEARQEAVLDFEELKYHPLFIAGIMAYFGQGDKTSKTRVSLSNIDSNAINVFKLFLENICGCRNYRVRLLLYRNLDEKICEDYWMLKCGLKHEYFGKSTMIGGKDGVKSTSYGICNIHFSSAYLKNKILKWIDLMISDLIEEKYLLPTSALSEMQ